MYKVKYDFCGAILRHLTRDKESGFYLLHYSFSDSMD